MTPSASEPEPVATALDRIDSEHDVSVRVAAETGSRAWGYAGPASDHDVGVVYAQRPPEYVVLDGYTSAIHDEFCGVDVRAWNLTRFAELLCESNPTVLAFLASPTVYRTCPGVEAVREHALTSFSPIDVYHHYRSLATGQYDSGTSVSRLLHVVRAALYARYVLDTHTFPDPVFSDFLDTEGARFPGRWVAAARTLCDRKRAGEGDEEYDGDFPEGLLDLSRDVDPEAHAVRGIERERVNEFVRAAFEDAYSTV